LTHGIKIDHHGYARSNSALVQTHLHTLIKSINIQRDAAARPPEYEQQAAMITARLNRLPASRYTWQLIALLSLCGFFEIYEIALTSTLSPGLIRAGYWGCVNSSGTTRRSAQAMNSHIASRLPFHHGCEDSCATSPWTKGTSTDAPAIEL
jgi:hypothetical protein